MGQTYILRTDQFETDSLSLEKGEFARVRETAAVEIRVLAGAIWMTSEGRPEDLVLEAGDCVRTENLKSVLLEAMTESVVLHWRLLLPAPEITKEPSDTPSKRSPTSGGYRAASSHGTSSPYGPRAAQCGEQRGPMDERIGNR